MNCSIAFRIRIACVALLSLVYAVSAEAEEPAKPERSVLVLRRKSDSQKGILAKTKAAPPKGTVAIPKQQRFAPPNKGKQAFTYSEATAPPVRSLADNKEPAPFPKNADTKQLNPDDTAPSEADMLITKAVSLSNHAQSRDDFSEVIRLCEVAAFSAEKEESANYALRLASWAVNRRGELAANLGENEVALADFQQAIDIDAGCWQAVHNRAVSYASQGENTKAMQDFDRVILLKPQFAVAYRNRAELKNVQGHIAGSIEDYSRAIALSPEQSTLWRMRGQAAHRLGKYEAAVRDFNASLERNPQNAATYTDRGNLYAELGYYHEALTDFREALRVDDRHASAYRSVAWVLATCPDAQFRNPEKALIAARRAVSFSGYADPFHYDALAAAKASNGQFKEAIQSEHRAIALADDQTMVIEFTKRLQLYQKGRAHISAPQRYTISKQSRSASTNPEAENR